MEPTHSTNPPAPDNLYFIHLSDTHVIPPPRGLYEGDGPANNFRRVIAAARALDVDPAFFLVTGDLSERGEFESYARLMDLVAEVEDQGYPVLLTLGNHDNRDNFYRVFMGRHCDEEERYCYTALLGGLRVVVLDSLVSGRGHGELGREQLEWLDKALGEPDAPHGTVLAFHHPPNHTGATWVDHYKLDDSEALREVIAGRAVQGFLTGHTHYPSVGAFGGAIAATAPGVVDFCDPSSQNGLRTLAGSGFNLVSVRGGEMAVHPVMLPGPRHVLRYENDAAVAHKVAGLEALQASAGSHNHHTKEAALA